MLLQPLRLNCSPVTSHNALSAKVQSAGGHYRHSEHTNVCHGKTLAQDAV